MEVYHDVIIFISHDKKNVNMSIYEFNIVTMGKRLRSS